MKPLKIGITLGDPGGIGPEVVLKALFQDKNLPAAQYVLFGSRAIVEEEKKNLGLETEIHHFEEDSDRSFSGVSLFELPDQEVKKGCPSKENGAASFEFFQAALEVAQRGELQALVTAPISKTSWRMAGIPWSGHTDFLQHFFPRAMMFFWSENLKVALLSHHLPLKEALKKVKRESLLSFFRSLHQNLRLFPQGEFELLVAGLNPHAGEGGILGSEEKEEIEPAVRSAQEEGINIHGPFPPDTVFREAFGNPEKIVISLYHDQGLIPFKLISFEKGVNLTLGLPFVRTSPDHGTAFAIAGRGVANPLSMAEAIRLAFKLSSL